MLEYSYIWRNGKTNLIENGKGVKWNEIEPWTGMRMLEELKMKKDNYYSWIHCLFICINNVCTDKYNFTII